MPLKNLKLNGLAAPISAGEFVPLEYERAQIHPAIGYLCCIFMEDIKPMMYRDGQRKLKHLDIAARAFFSGAFELGRYSNNGQVDKQPDGTLDDNTLTGALTLFVGGTMQRGGFYKTVEHYATLWRKQNVEPATTRG